MVNGSKGTVGGDFDVDVGVSTGSGVDIRTFGTLIFVALVCAGFSVGVASAQGQTEVSEPGDLTEVSVDGNYVLVSDINASGLEGFEPIGDEEEPFTGTFEGDGNVISGLTVNRSDEEQVGLFGYVGSDGTVTNVGLKDVEVTGGDSTGGLVGRNEGEVSRSHVMGSVEGNDNVGGLVGRNVGSVSESYASAEVVGRDRVGGIVGRNVGSVSESYATGSAEGVSAVGGAVGNNVGELTDAYAITDVEGQRKIGGLVGDDLGGTIERTYAAGTVGSAMGAGGLIGVRNSNTVVDDSYWDEGSLGEESSGGEALSTDEMTGVGAEDNMNFDFNIDEVWETRDGDHPALSWQVHGYDEGMEEVVGDETQDNRQDEQQNETDEEDDEYEPPGEGLPGFGAVVALVALVVCGAFLRKMR